MTEINIYNKLGDSINLLCDRYLKLQEENEYYKQRVNELLKEDFISSTASNFQEFIWTVDTLLSRYILLESEAREYKDKIMEVTSNGLYTPEIFKEIIWELDVLTEKNKQLQNENIKKIELETKVNDLERKVEDLTNRISNIENDKKSIEEQNKSLLWEIDCLSTDYWLEEDYEWLLLSEWSIEQIELDKKWRIFNCLELNQNSDFDNITTYIQAKTFLYLQWTYNISTLKLIYRG